MGNLMTSMWTGVSGLRVSQTSMNTTAHNISNIDTKGYVRQQMLLTNGAINNIGTTHISTLQVGLGSDVQSIRQVRDVFLDKSYRLEFGRQEFYQVQADAATEIETILGEFGDTTFATSLADLWSAITDVAEEPDSIVKRSLLASTAISFISYAEALDDQLNEYQKKINEKIATQVNRINEIGDEIHQLNIEIIYQESTGQNANDYRDRRNMLLDELAGYTSITYQEDIDGRVLVNVEGTQFVTLDRVFHMETEEITEEEKQEVADTINKWVSGEPTLADGTATDNLLEVIQGAGGNLQDVRDSAAWKELSKYGSLGIEKQGTDYVITFNDIQLVKTPNGDPNDLATKVLEYNAQPTGFHNVIWSHTGGDVFRLTGDYASFNNTDVGSLKSILVARGNYTADYLDIPQKADYLAEVKKEDYVDVNDVFNEAEYNKAYEEALAKYEEAVEKYNKELGACLLTSTQAQIDLLVHEVVTTVNDILCPNIDITADAVANILKLEENKEVAAADVDVQNTTINIGGTTYTLKEANEAGFQMLDIEHASIGMDENQTIGEALFERKNMERYTEAEITIVQTDGTTTTKTVKVYNKEYETNVHSMFTIGHIEVNQDMVDDVSKMPLSYNKYSSLYGGYDYDICQKILDVWGTDSIQLAPNILTPYNFSDYYDAVSGNVGTVSGLYSSELKMLEETVNGVGNSRESILGVSSEEELTNLIMYQHAYNASSRYINAINELLMNVINIGN